MFFPMDEYENGTCETCGTHVFRNRETLVEVHADATYENCGAAQTLARLAAGAVRR
jgi:hypothetical protein